MAWHSTIAIVTGIRRPLKRLINITLFSAAMGYLEAVAVVYLRSILTRRADWLVIEITREFATIVMLITFAVASGRNARERTGVFYGFSEYGISSITLDYGFGCHGLKTS